MKTKRKKKRNLKKLGARQIRLLSAIKDDYERALMRKGEDEYVKVLKESIRRVESDKKP